MVLPGWRSAPDQGSPAQRTLVRWGANRWASWSQPSPAGCHDALLAASVEVPRAPSAPPRTLASPRTEVRRRSVKRVGRTPCQTPRRHGYRRCAARLRSPTVGPCVPRIRPTHDKRSQEALSSAASRRATDAVPQWRAASDPRAGPLRCCRCWPSPNHDTRSGDARRAPSPVA